MAFLTSTQILTFAPEVGAGTYNTAVSATNLTFRTEANEFKNEVARDNENHEIATGTWHGSDYSLPTMRTNTTSTTIQICPGEFTPATSSAAPVDAGHKLNYGFLFESCGMTQIPLSAGATNNTPATYAYYPDMSKAEKTLSIAHIMYDSVANVYEIDTASGAVGNFVISVDGTSMPFMCKFDFNGKAETSTNSVNSVGKFITSANMKTYADQFKNTTITLTNTLTSASSSFCVTKMSFDAGAEKQMNECQDNSTGLLDFMITKISPKLTIDPLVKTLSQFDHWKAMSTSTSYTVSIDSEFFHLYIPNAEITSITTADSNGKMRNEMSLRVLQNENGLAPSWLPLASRPSNLYAIPYFMAIEENTKQR